MLPELKLIVAGGRDFNDYALMEKLLNQLANEEYEKYSVSIVSGMARGADALAARFAEENNIQLYEFPADWNQHGRGAGYVRNREMAVFADALVAFWDGESKGTANMIKTMHAMHKRTHVYYY